MKRYCIDSSVFIRILRKKSPITELFGMLPGTVVTSSICIAELYEGVFRSKYKQGSLDQVEKILATISSIFPFSNLEAKTFGELKVALKHQPIPDLDIQIAATCLYHKLTLVTLDMKHFPRVKGLEILDLSKNL